MGWRMTKRGIIEFLVIAGMILAIGVFLEKTAPQEQHQMGAPQ
jgi:hypothetical protein